MAESVFLDLVTPEGSPEPVARPEEGGAVAPLAAGDPVAQDAEEGPVAQVAEGGPGRSAARPLVGIRLIQAGDWAPGDADLAPGQLPSFLNTRYWTTQVLGEEVEGSQAKVVDPSKFSLSLWTPNDGVRPIKVLFPKVACDVKILAMFAHSAPYRAADYNLGKNDPRQYISLGHEDSFNVSLKGVADELCSQTKRIRYKYDVIFLGCCQGDRLALLIKKAVHPEGLVIFFGADEDEQDGAAAGLVSEVWEGLLERCKEYISTDRKLDWKEVFEKTYIEVGQDYLAPKGQEGRRVAGLEEDFEFMDCILDMSVKTASKLPTFVEHYTFAGDLHAFMDGVDLVTDELKSRRKAFMAERQAEVDHEHHGGRKGDSPPAARSKRSRA